MLQYLVRDSNKKGSKTDMNYTRTDYFKADVCLRSRRKKVEFCMNIFMLEKMYKESVIRQYEEDFRCVLVLGFC